MGNQTAKFENQDYIKLKKQCLNRKELFSDDLFKLDVKGAEWLRPNQIVKNPRFFVEGATRFDVVQGANSGCWLLVAMANLTRNPTLFHHVVPTDQSFIENYAGIFHFNIWQCGVWTEIVVDDRLPTKKGNLMFAHSKDKNEFWSALLEKAYAKIYGSYNELTVGWFTEAMVDFTGGVVERVKMSEPPLELKGIVIRSLEKGSFICVFMSNDPDIEEMIQPNGLIKGHAYSLNKQATVHKGGQSVFLVRLRNPWGKLEWKGPWSDKSPEWQSVSEHEKKTLGLVSDNDGEFWMPFSEFIKNFQCMDICHLSPELFKNKGRKDKVGWESRCFKGEWTKGVTAGGVNLESFHLNPQYRITLTASDDDSANLCTVLIGILQKNKSRQTWHRIGFTAFHLTGPEKKSKKPLSRAYLCENFDNCISSDIVEKRENVVRQKWQPGVYCIIPHTHKPDQEGEYYLRVFSEKKASVKSVKKK